MHHHRHQKPLRRDDENHPTAAACRTHAPRPDLDRRSVQADGEAHCEQKYRVTTTVLDDAFAIIARKPDVRSRNCASGSHAEHFVRRSRTAIATRYFCSQCASSSDCENVGDKQAGRDRAQKLAREELRARRVARGASFLGLGEKCRSIGSPRHESRCRTAGRLSRIRPKSGRRTPKSRGGFLAPSRRTPKRRGVVLDSELPK